MEQWKKKNFVRQFLTLSEEKQDEVISLMEDFKLARQRKQNQKAYHMKRPINRTRDSFGV